MVAIKGKCSHTTFSDAASARAAPYLLSSPKKTTTEEGINGEKTEEKKRSRVFFIISKGIELRGYIHER